MRLMLRVVDIATWTNSTPARQIGIHFVELPGDWSELGQADREVWQGEQEQLLREQLGEHVRGMVSEVVDVEETQYAAELADSLLPDEPSAPAAVVAEAVPLIN